MQAIRERFSKLAIAAACGAVLAYALVLGDFYLTGLWILDAAGRPAIVDFLPVHVAGQLAAGGQAARVYDWRLFHQAQAVFVGHGFAGYLGWHYPPLFLTVAILLAQIPYPAAFLAWTLGTALAFCASLRAIAQHWAAPFLALALPPAFACAYVGQNGFFTAALLAAMLLFLPRRPVLAGVFLALLTYKPQFGLLLPFALIAGGYYRSVLVAAALALGWIALNLWLSPQTFAGFVHFLPETGAAVLRDGTTGWGKLQSLYALVRQAGGSDLLAWAAQGVTASLLAVLCIALWRRRDIAFGLKAACLATGCLLASPYAYFYDLPLLAVPLAFLYRARAFDRTEYIVTACVLLLLAGFYLVQSPVGVFAGLAILALTLRRIASVR